MTSLLLSLCNTVSAQQPNSPVDIAASAKTVADSVAQITLPVSLPEGETIESFLLKHDVYKDEEGNYFSQFFGEKKKMIAKDVEFWLLYWAVKKVPLGSDPNGTFFVHILFMFYAHIIKLFAMFTAN